MTPRTFDLNNADDARDYLTTLEADGHLIYDGPETSQELDDKDAMDVAAMVFSRFNEDAAGPIQ